MNKNVARRPRFKRVSDFPSIRLTTRDREILSAVCRYRFLTTSHILSLIPGSRQNIARRLQRLYHSGFLNRPSAQMPLRFARQISELVYCPTRKSFRHDEDCCGRTASGNVWNRVSSLFLLHSLSVSGALISLKAGCNRHGFRFVSEEELLGSLPNESKSNRIQWRTTIKSGKTSERVGVIPDATFSVVAITDTGIRSFYYFLEVDRGTMPLHRKTLRHSSIRRKALAYSQTRRGKILRDRYDIPGFQVIFISPAKKRMEGIKKICNEAENGRATSLFCFASEHELDDFFTWYN